MPQPIPATLIPGDGIGPEIVDSTLAALYANLRPARTLIPGGRFDNIDLVVVREFTRALVNRIANADHLD